MLDLAKHIIEQMTGKFEPEQFQDRYENALIELIRSKQAGATIKARPVQRQTNVINLMDALRRSVEGEKASPEPASAKKAAKGKSTARGKAKGSQSELSRLSTPVYLNQLNCPCVSARAEPRLCRRVAIS